MKRVLSYILILLLIVSMLGCQSEKKQQSGTPIVDNEEQVGGNLDDNTGGDTGEDEGDDDQSKEETGGEETPAPIPTPTPTPTPTPLPNAPSDNELVKVSDYLPNITIELPYATTDNFTGYRIYDFADAYLRYGTIKKLSKVCDELAVQGIGLKLWDGFRPVSAQQKLWQICPNGQYVSHPVTGTRSHCKGNTVDITLIDLTTGKELVLPTEYDNFTAMADRDYSDCSEEAAKNAKLLEDTMKKYGFNAYYAEWWHFTDTKDYPVEEQFEPAVPKIWVIQCNQYVNLRNQPYGTSIAKIYNGQEVTLLLWNNIFAKVSYKGKTGYVMSNYMVPKNTSYVTDALDTVKVTNAYSYSQMVSDISKLQAKYPDLITVSSIGKSELGRNIPVIRLGLEDSTHHVLIQGAIHGREHQTAWLLMAMIDYWLEYDLFKYSDVCYHIIPMMNPDGVIVSQTGVLSAEQKQIYQSDRNKGNTYSDQDLYATQWKANGKGVDINRNFSAGWEEIEDRSGPSSERYKGEKPFSSAEAQALRDYTLSYEFDLTVSYHATGSLIYYEYGNNTAINNQSTSLANAVNDVTGYTLESSEGIDNGGYKDWVMEELGIPSITIEIGCGDPPLPEKEIDSIFARNYRVLPVIAQWLQ